MAKALPHAPSKVSHSALPMALPLERAASQAADGLPALLADAQALAATMMSGAHGRRRTGPGETFWQYRDYSVHDSASTIDWRQSARVPKRLFVRETEWETAATIRLWCDGNSSFDYNSETLPPKRWRGQVIALALGMMLARAGEHISVMPENMPALSGNQGIMRCAEGFLRCAGNANDTPILPPLPPVKTTQAVFISDFHAPSEDLLHRIESIASAGVACHFVQIADPSEANFPYAGHTIFEAPSGPAQAIRFGDAQAIRSAYCATRKAHRAAFKDQCARYGFCLLDHSTDIPPAQTLAALHLSISGRLDT